MLEFGLVVGPRGSGFSLDQLPFAEVDVSGAPSRYWAVRFIFHGRFFAVSLHLPWAVRVAVLQVCGTATLRAKIATASLPG